MLLVEDSWHLAQAQTLVLASVGVDVMGPVGTIAEAEALLAKRVPDVALVDLNLNGEMAYSLIDRLLQDDICVIVATGYEVLPHLEEKVAAILRKPFRASVLLATLHRIVDERHAP